uniref:Uncharacterized protein n=1 Tax=Arundo donax TaxID=35708 RepID=A0A0A9EMI4_ARUDO
MMTCKSRQKR